MPHAKVIETIIPSKKDTSLAELSSRVLATQIKSTRNPSIQVLIEEKAQESVTLPATALRLLVVSSTDGRRKCCQHHPHSRRTDNTRGSGAAERFPTPHG
jgi:hypothetical protein